MSYTEPDEEDFIEARKNSVRSGRTQLKFALVAGPLFVLFIYLISPQKVPFVNPKTKAEAFMWPKGCEEKEYNEQDIINKPCLEGKYYIGDGEKWGWPRGSKPSSYYRVGNHAFDMGCNIYTGTCYVHRIVQDTFAVSN